jgi:hypothetical protein
MWAGLIFVLFSLAVVPSLWSCCLLLCLVLWDCVSLVRGYQSYCSNVDAFRRRAKTTLIVFDPEFRVQALELLRDTSLQQKAVESSNFDPWDLLKGSRSVRFLLGSSSGRFMEFLEHEAHTRRIFSEQNSYRDNMLDSAESERRLAFQRLKFSTSSSRVSFCMQCVSVGLTVRKKRFRPC